MAEALEKYRAKRDFSKTAEPAGKTHRAKVSADGGGIFVVQKHAATRLHYDFRLEHDGVLWSWAVTRGPSLDPHEKRLAVHVEDHPVDYASFEGTIPKGEYGGGSVIVWDEGTWTPEHDPAAGMKKGHIDFELHGEKLTGKWHLVRLKPRPGEKKDNWLLIKSDDAAARPGEDILKDRPESVKSGLTVEDVGAGRAAGGGKPKVWHSNRPATGRARREMAAKLDFVEPALATLERDAPSGREWLHEVKFDGYRVQGQVAGTEVRLLTRTGLDWTGRFGAEIPAALAGLECSDAILDGEIVVLADNGVSSFSLLQADLSAGRTDRMVYYVFDLLRLDGEDLRGEPLVERKERLRELLEQLGDDGPVRFSDHFVEPGKVMLRHACRMGLEGVVSKRADAPYLAKRTKTWLKVKCTRRQEFVVVGWSRSDAKGRAFRALLLAQHEGRKLVYKGKVGTGFDTAELIRLMEIMKPIEQSAPTVKAPRAEVRGAHWLKPKLVAEIAYTEMANEGTLRHPSYLGLREDKKPEAVVLETAAPVETVTAPSSVKISNPERIIDPDSGITKGALADHYAAVAAIMLPWVGSRPISLVRCPQGRAKKCFSRSTTPAASA